MKRFPIVLLIFFAAMFVYAQQQDVEVGETDPSLVGIDAAEQYIIEVSIDRFEFEGFWRSSISPDDGYSTSRLFESPGAMGKRPIRGEENMDIQDKFVLGTRVDFLRRGYSSFFIFPTRPLPIEGITKTISMQVAGRNFNHELFVLIQDFFGRYFELSMGKLNHQGWKQMTATVPPQSPDGFSGIIQRNYHYTNQAGIKIIGFRIDCDPMQARGSYYVYFDDLRAHTDVYTERFRDESNDMPDGW